MRRFLKEHTVELDEEKKYWCCIECESRTKVMDHHITYLPIQTFFIPATKVWDSYLPVRNVKENPKLKNEFLHRMKSKFNKKVFTDTLRTWGDERCKLIADLVDMSNTDEVLKLVNSFYTELYWFTYVADDSFRKKIKNNAKRK